MSRTTFQTVAAFGLIGALAACGGGGGGADGSAVTPPPSMPPTPDMRSGDAMRAARATLLSSYASPPDYTALSAIPTSGTATYDGYLSGTLANTGDTITDTLIGQMRLNVTFTASSVNVSGAVSNFVDADDDALSGTLALQNGSLDRAGNPASDATLLMNATGTLTDDQGRDLEIGTQLEGDFLSARHRAVGGEVLGSVTVNGVDQDFDGGFIGAR